MFISFLAFLFLWSAAAQSATILQPQSSGIEPALADRSDIIAWEGFEDNPWYAKGWWVTMDKSPLTTNPKPEGAIASVTTADKVTGNRSLRVAMKAGKHYGISAAILMPPGIKEAYFRYYWKVPIGQTKPGGKMFGFRSGPIQAGTCPNGTNKWNARFNPIEWNSSTSRSVEDGSGNSFRYSWITYHMDSRVSNGLCYGETFWFQDRPAVASVRPKNEWQCAEGQVKLNTYQDGVARANGILRAWVNGEFVHEKTNMRWVSGPQVDRIELFDLYTYTGGAHVVPFDSFFYVDNLVVAKNRIGCHANNGAGEAISPPEGLEVREP